MDGSAGHRLQPTCEFPTAQPQPRGITTLPSFSPDSGHHARVMRTLQSIPPAGLRRLSFPAGGRLLGSVDLDEPEGPRRYRQREALVERAQHSSREAIGGPPNTGGLGAGHAQFVAVV